MKNRLSNFCIISLLSFLSLTACRHEKEKQKNNATDIEFSHQTDSSASANIQNGLSTLMYPNGKKKMEGSFANGKRIGNWMAWYENGILWSQGNYIDGKRNGYSALYYPDGKLRAEGAYKNDKRIGQWSFYGEDGSLVKEINYDNNHIIEHKKK
jgi:antitoxin component YwqK of YwqJK toxin-antitoxin module